MDDSKNLVSKGAYSPLSFGCVLIPESAFEALRCGTLTWSLQAKVEST